MTGHLHPYTLKSGCKAWAIVFFLGKRVDADGTLKRRYRWIRGFATKRDADAELRRLLRSVDDGTYIHPSNETLAEYLDRWLRTFAKPNVAAKTFERYQQIVERDIKPRLGHIRLSRLAPLQLAEFYAWALESGRKRSPGGLSARTVLHFHRLLHSALKQAVIWQLRSTNPCDAVEPPRPVDKEMTAVDEERSAWLISAATGTEFYVPVLYALCTGLRRGEILAQRWQDVDVEMGRLVVAQSLEQTRSGGLKFKIPKSKKRRTITMLPLLADALTNHRNSQARNREMFGKDYRADLDLIVAMPDGSPWPPDSFTAAYADFAAKIGMRGVRFHDLRHSHASQLLRQGVPVKTVQERLGHANASVTLNTYAHVLAGDDQRAVNVLEQRLRSAIEKQSSRRAN